MMKDLNDFIFSSEATFTEKAIKVFLFQYQNNQVYKRFADNLNCDPFSIKAIKQIPFFLFLALLAVVYIYNGHYADKTIRSINKSARELKELQYEYKTVKGDVLFRSKQSELVRAVEPLGLKELIAAPLVLIDSSNVNNN